jgi:hypothetical protein
MRILCILLLCGVAEAHPVSECKQQPPIRAQDKAFLDAHNKRRQTFHEDYGVSYVPLKWSLGLKRQSARWARHLVKKVCSGQGSIYHDPNNNFGENIASNKGSGSWGKKPLPENILTRFVENEVDTENNGHLTQVLWRPTKYVGCAIAAATAPDKPNVKCHVTVCRYAKPGNCNMGRFPDWESATYQDDSPCRPECPPEGC